MMAIEPPKLDAEEQEILDSYDADEWQPIEERETEMAKFRQYARATFKKDKRVNIRISEKALAALQKKAPP